MKWVVAILAVLLAATIAAGSLVILSMRDDISALQHPHSTTVYVTRSELNASQGFLLKEIATARAASPDSSTVQNLQNTVACLQRAAATDSASVHVVC